MVIQLSNSFIKVRYTKAQTKDLEKEEAGQIYSKVAESGIEEFPGNQITIWTETFDTIQSEFK